jgi:urea transport system permease protein
MFLPSALTAAIWIVLGLAPLAVDDWTLTQLAQYMAYGIFAMGLGFIWGQAGILSFGQAIFFGTGAYCMGLITLSKLPLLGSGTAAGLVFALVLPGLIAYLLGRLLFLGKGLSGAYFAIVTLCAAVVVETLAQRWSLIGGFNGLLGISPFAAPWRNGADAYLTPAETYVTMLGVAALVFACLLFVVRSPVGTALAAIRDNDVRTAFFGYDIARLKVWSLVVSAVVSGLAGALFVKQFGFVAPSLIGFGLSTEVLIWVAVGGRNGLMAAFLGAVLVRSVEGALSDRLGDYWLLVLGVLFVLTVILMPNGLFGRILALPPPSRLRRSSNRV